MTHLFYDETLIEDFAEYLNQQEEQYDINSYDDYIEYIDNFVGGTNFEDLASRYIIGDVDMIGLFIYIRETDNDVLEFITEYMKDENNCRFTIRFQLIKISIDLYLRDVEEIVKDVYIDKYINSEKKRLDCNP